MTKHMNNAIHVGIQSGDNTQNQDHTMMFISLSTMKTIVNKPRNEMPPVEVVDDCMILCLNYFIC